MERRGEKRDKRIQQTTAYGLYLPQLWLHLFPQLSSDAQCGEEFLTGPWWGLPEPSMKPLRWSRCRLKKHPCLIFWAHTLSLTTCLCLSAHLWHLYSLTAFLLCSPYAGATLILSSCLLFNLFLSVSILLFLPPSPCFLKLSLHPSPFSLVSFHLFRASWHNRVAAADCFCLL